jgi:hypothetical protein
LHDYANSSVDHSELYEHGEKIKETLSKLAREMEKLNRSLEQIVPLGDATGLSLSLPTLKNLQRLMRDEDEFEKINPAGCDFSVFREVLGISSQMALQLRNFFLDSRPDKKIEEVEGITDELIQKTKKCFIL